MQQALEDKNFLVLRERAGEDFARYANLAQTIVSLCVFRASALRNR
jgi:hypothetical protein